MRATLISASWGAFFFVFGHFLFTIGAWNTYDSVVDKTSMEACIVAGNAFYLISAVCFAMAVWYAYMCQKYR